MSRSRMSSKVSDKMSTRQQSIYERVEPGTPRGLAEVPVHSGYFSDGISDDGRLLERGCCFWVLGAGGAPCFVRYC